MEKTNKNNIFHLNNQSHKIRIILLIISFIFVSAASILIYKKIDRYKTEKDYQKFLENYGDKLDLWSPNKKAENDRKTDNSNTTSTASSNTDINTDIDATNITLETVELSDGSYTVGSDINAGTYNVEAISGYGKLTGDFASGYLSMGIGISDRYPDHKGYNNLKLTNGDEFTIKAGVTLKFSPVN